MIGLDRSFGVAAGASERNWRASRRPDAMSKDMRTAARGVTFAVFLCAAVLASHDARAQMMSLPGTFNVTESGAATYSIPISVPPGTAGMVPSLSLDYNSQGGNGLLGMGWSLTGLPSIGRCPRTQAQDGVRGAVKYDMNDRFCMEGQRLVLVSGTYGAAESEYRTEIEGFSKITAKGSAGNGPAWFEVKTKSGQVMEFGNTADSLFLAQGKTTARGWGVNRISDAVGNYLTVTYHNDSAATGEAYPLRIDYTGNDTASLEPYNSVQFVWEWRGARQETRSYVAGSVVGQTMALTRIEIYEAENAIGIYKLEFANIDEIPTGSPPVGAFYSPFVGEVLGTYRLRLESISLCDESDVCLPSTTFEWTPDPKEISKLAGDAPPAQHGVTLGDFNGDGKTDIFFCLYDSYPRCSNPSAAQVWFSNGDGTFNKVSSNAVPVAHGRPFAGDFNGDGLTDFFFCNHDIYYRCYSNYYHLSLSNGDGTFTKIALPNGPANALPLLGDFNGNGRTDIFFCTGDAYRRCDATAPKVWLSNGDGSFAVVTSGVLPATGSIVHVGDFDGDGKTDLLSCQGNAQGQCIGDVHTLRSSGNGAFVDLGGIAAPSGTYPSGSQYWAMMSVLEVNGDGNSDVLFCWVDCKGGGTGETFFWVSKGDANYEQISVFGWPFWLNLAGTPLIRLAAQGDFNGDGKSNLFFCVKDNSNRCEGAAAFGGTTVWSNIYPDLTTSGIFKDPLNPNDKFLNRMPVSGLVYAGDFDGNGRSDLWICATDAYSRCGGATSYLWSFGDLSTPPPDLLSSFTTGLGVRTEITYRPLTDGDVYTKGTGSVYPVVDVQAPMHVVARVDADDGIGGTYSSEYRYEGAKADLNGRGFLGFRRHVAKDLETGIEQATEFLQEFPYIGRVERQEKRFDAQLLNEVTNSWTSVSYNGGKRRQVLLEESLDTSFDLDGSPIPAVTTSYTYDNFSNPTQIVVSTPDGASKTTVNSYNNNTTTWRLGRLTRTTVTSTVP